MKKEQKQEGVQHQGEGDLQEKLERAHGSERLFTQPVKWQTEQQHPSARQSKIGDKTRRKARWEVGRGSVKFRDVRRPKRRCNDEGSMRARDATVKKPLCKEKLWLTEVICTKILSPRVKEAVFRNAPGFQTRILENIFWILRVTLFWK